MEYLNKADRIKKYQSYGTAILFLLLILACTKDNSLDLIFTGISAYDLTGYSVKETGSIYSYSNSDTKSRICVERISNINRISADRLIVDDITDIKLIDVNIPGSFSGKTLIDLILHNNEVNQYCFAYSEYLPIKQDTVFSNKTTICSVRDKKWKLIVYQEFVEDRINENQELFDISMDPEEKNDLSHKNENIL